MGRLKATYRMPLDVILEILVWLPAKSALRFKCVCKDWYNLINTPLFTKLHLNKSLQPNSKHNHALVYTPAIRIVDDLYHPSKWTVLNWPEDAIRDCNSKVVGSCNGLVCFKVTVWHNDATAMHGHYYTVRCFFICNPTTRTFKLIIPCSENEWRDDSLSYGFGYDSDHDDYKIVVTSRVWTESDRDVLIFSLKADLWSCRPTPPLPRVSSGRIWVNRKKAIFRDKMLHYLTKTADDGRYEASKNYRIACFDVVSEKWRDDLCFPAQLKKDPVRLGVLDGWLYLRGGRSKSEVWMMEEHGSWKNMFHIPRAFCWHRLIGGSKDGRNRLLLYDPTDFIGHRDVLFWYDRQEKRRIPFNLKPSPLYAQATPYIASLVKIHGCAVQKLQEIKM